MASKRKILEAMTRTGLLDIARLFEVGGLTNESKAGIVDALAGNRKVQPEEFLGQCSRDELKGLCEALGLDTTGREKQVLVDRLLGRDSVEEVADPAPAVELAKPKEKKAIQKSLDLNVEDYRHAGTKRKNNPPAKIAAEGSVPAMPKITYSYSPRRPPVLRYDTTGKADRLPELLEKATKGPLSREEAQILAEALRTQQPWLEWAGKQEAEQAGFTVDPVALHIHERVSSQAILKIAARIDVERTLFSDPEQEYHEAVQFYKHDIDWTNRLILGDSLQVMASLASREDLAGRVHMFFFDPPYGISFRSNFQPRVNERGVTQKPEDLTREAEMVKAYRDTWNLGLHSYLSYLRDRLMVMRDLLHSRGSIFVQIGDDNVHKVRAILDEVFGEDNFVNQIAFTKGGAGLETDYRLPTRLDYILWYARDNQQMRFNKLRDPNAVNREGTTAGWYETSTGHLRRLTAKERQDGITVKAGDRLFIDESLTKPGPGAKYEVSFQGRRFDSGRRWWGTPKESLQRALRAERSGSSPESVGKKLG